MRARHCEMLRLQSLSLQLAAMGILLGVCAGSDLNDTSKNSIFNELESGRTEKQSIILKALLSFCDHGDCMWPYGHSVKIAMEMVKEMLNAAHFVGHGFELVIDYADSGCDQNMATREFLQMLDSSRLGDRIDIFGIIGPCCNTEAKAIVPLADFVNKFVISGVVTDVRFDDRSKFPHFWRTITPETGCRATFTVIKWLGWNQVGMVWGETQKFGLIWHVAQQDLEDLGMSMQIPFGERKQHLDSGASDLAQVINPQSAMAVAQILKRSRVRPIVALMDREGLKLVFCAYTLLGIKASMWFLHGGIDAGWFKSLVELENHGTFRGTTYVSSCTPEMLADNVEFSIYFGSVDWHPDPSASLQDCAINMTAGEFRALYETRAAEAGVPAVKEAGSFADAVCMYGLTLRELIQRNYNTHDFRHISSELFSEVQEIFANSNFVGPGGVQEFGLAKMDPRQSGAGSRRGPMMLQQFIANVRVDRMMVLYPYNSPSNIIHLGTNLTFRNDDGSISFTPPTGTFPTCNTSTVFNFTSAACEPCSWQGKMKDQIENECVCGIGHSNLNGTCTQCVPGRFSLDGLLCVECPSGRFAPISGQTECARCPRGGACLRGGSIAFKARPGYYIRGSQKELVVSFVNHTDVSRDGLIGIGPFLCRPPSACLGDNLCHPYMEGFVCGGCKHGFKRTLPDDLCSKCPDPVNNTFVLVFLLIGGAILLLLVDRKNMHQVGKRSIGSVVFKIMCNFFVQVSVISKSFNLEGRFTELSEFKHGVIAIIAFLPTHLASLIGHASTGPSNEWFSSDCWLQDFFGFTNSQHAKIVMAIITIPVVLIAVYSLAIPWMLFNRKKGRQIKTTCARITVWVMYVLHPSVTTSLLKAFECAAVDPNSLKYEVRILMLDTRIECNDAKHAKFQVLAGFGLAVWTLGIPAAFWILLREFEQSTEQDLQSERVQKNYGFLYSGFEPDKYYYESIFMMRRAGYLCITAFPSLSMHSRMLILLAANLTFTAMNLLEAPFDNRANFGLDRLEHLSSAAIVSLLLAHIFSLSPSKRDEEMALYAYLPGSFCVMYLWCYALYLLFRNVLWPRNKQSPLVAVLPKWLASQWQCVMHITIVPPGQEEAKQYDHMVALCSDSQRKVVQRANNELKRLPSSEVQLFSTLMSDIVDIVVRRHERSCGVPAEVLCLPSFFLQLQRIFLITIGVANEYRLKALYEPLNEDEPRNFLPMAWFQKLLSPKRSLQTFARENTPPGFAKDHMESLKQPLSTEEILEALMSIRSTLTSNHHIKNKSVNEVVDRVLHLIAGISDGHTWLAELFDEKTHKRLARQSSVTTLSDSSTHRDSVNAAKSITAQISGRVSESPSTIDVVRFHACILKVQRLWRNRRSEKCPIHRRPPRERERLRRNWSLSRCARGTQASDQVVVAAKEMDSNTSKADNSSNDGHLSNQTDADLKRESKQITCAEHTLQDENGSNRIRAELKETVERTSHDNLSKDKDADRARSELEEALERTTSELCATKLALYNLRVWSKSQLKICKTVQL